MVHAGTVKQLLKNKDSLTGQYLSGKRSIPVPEMRRSPGDEWITIKGAREHNLQNIDVDIPLGCFVSVTGVSGSGKSTLINDILLRSLMQRIYTSKVPPGLHTSVEGIEHLDKVIDIDQSPIGRTPRSNPATYTGVFDHVRKLFSQTQEAKVRGYLPGRFSFNVKGGRCEACAGDGTIKIEMHFLPDVYVPCEVCKGARYNRDTLDITFKDKNIAEVLDMPFEEALEFFANQPVIARHMQTLVDVGLGYVRLGQPATTLSGGEAQRIKLASELSKRSTGHTIYLLDEPTTGLHFEDIRKLLTVLDRLVDQGNTVARDRAQPRRHQDRRLAHRPRARGRQRRRDRRGRGAAGARGEDPGELHRPVPGPPAPGHRLTRLTCRPSRPVGGRWVGPVRPASRPQVDVVSSRGTTQPLWIRRSASAARLGRCRGQGLGDRQRLEPAGGRRRRPSGQAYRNPKNLGVAAARNQVCGWAMRRSCACSTAMPGSTRTRSRCWPARCSTIGRSVSSAPSTTTSRRRRPPGPCPPSCASWPGPAGPGGRSSGTAGPSTGSAAPASCSAGRRSTTSAATTSGTSTDPRRSTSACASARQGSAWSRSWRPLLHEPRPVARRRTTGRRVEGRVGLLNTVVVGARQLLRQPTRASDKRASRWRRRDDRDDQRDRAGVPASRGRHALGRCPGRPTLERALSHVVPMRLRSFTAGGATYRYFVHAYNPTWRSERAVEIPLALEFRARMSWTRRGDRQRARPLRRHGPPPGRQVRIGSGCPEHRRAGPADRPARLDHRGVDPRARGVGRGAQGPDEGGAGGGPPAQPPRARRPPVHDGPGGPQPRSRPGDQGRPGRHGAVSGPDRARGNTWVEVDELPDVAYDSHRHTARAIWVGELAA